MSTTSQPTTTDEPYTPTPGPGTPVHEVLLSNDGVKTDALTHVATLRAFFEDVPQTKATFKYAEAFADGGAFGRPNTASMADLSVESALTDAFVRMAGGWPSPEHYPGNQKHNRYVNPRYAHAHTYPELTVRCECGALVVHERDRTDGGHPIADSHTDECLPQWRFRARASVLDERKRIAERDLQRGFSLRQIAPKVGATRESYRWTRGIGIDTETAKESYRRLTANTAAILLRERSANLVATAYGLSKQHINRLVKDYTDADPMALYQYRRGKMGAGDD